MNKDEKLSRWRQSVRPLPTLLSRPQRSIHSHYASALVPATSCLSSLALGHVLIAVQESALGRSLAIADEHGAIWMIPLCGITDTIRAEVANFLESSRPKVLLKGKSVYSELGKLGLVLSGEILDLEICSNLLGVNPLDIALDKGCSQESSLRALLQHRDVLAEQIAATAMCQVAEAEHRCTPILAELEQTGIAIDLSLASKLDSQFAAKLQRYMEPNTSRVRSTYNQLGTDTGRITSSGFNIQGVPRDPRYRACFVAAPGCKLIIGDYSQMELRVIAEVTGDVALREALRVGDDIHLRTASILTGKPEKDIKPPERQAAKAVNFGLMYGMGLSTLQQRCIEDFKLALDPVTLSHVRSSFFLKYIGIADWHAALKKASTLEVRTLGNRMRRWSEEPRPTVKFNTIIQGSAADIFKKALTYLHSEITGVSAPPKWPNADCVA